MKRARFDGHPKWAISLQVTEAAFVLVSIPKKYDFLCGFLRCSCGPRASAVSSGSESEADAEFGIRGGCFFDDFTVLNTPCS